MLLLLAPLLAVSLFAEGIEFNRIKPFGDKNELTIETGVIWYNVTMAEYYNYFVNPFIAVDYVFEKKHTVAITIPYSFYFIGINKIEKKFYHSGGDLQVSYDYRKQIKLFDTFFGSFLEIPLNVSSEKANQDNEYSISSGRFNLGFSYRISGVRDPIVWTLDMKYWMGLPHNEDFYSSWQPAHIQLSGSILLFENDIFGGSVTLYQNFDFPQINDGKSNADDFFMSTLINCDAFMSFDKDYFIVRYGFYALPSVQPYVGIIYGHHFSK
jgi:hypothetical protein